MANLQFYTDLAIEMLKRDKERDIMFAEMNRMWMSDWDLPFEPKGYIHKVISTDPHDAVRSGMRVLSSGDPRIKLQPLSPDPDNRKKANRIERALYWHFKNASRRRSAEAVADVVLSALLYDEVCAQVVHIPWQIEQSKSLKQDTKRLEAAEEYGPFAVILRNPKDVHVTYSDYMAEEVLMQKVMSVEEIVSFWGKDNTKKLVKDAKNLKDNEGEPYATLYDYTDLDKRVVFAELQTRQDMLTEPGPAAVEIMNEDHGLPFLPWVCRVGGTNMFDSGIAQRIPMLWSIYMSGQWNTQNIIETLVASEALSYAGASRIAIEGPTPNIQVDYGEPGRPLWVPPGHSITDLRPPVIDAGLLAIGDRVADRMAKSTIPRVLQTGDVPSGTPFSALNLITQSGLKSLVPYKHLAEQSLSGIFRMMLKWIDHSGEEVTAFTERKSLNGDVYGEQITIKKGDFDVNNIYLTVELAEDAPVDRVARANVGRMMKTDMNYPVAKVMEFLGETDPDELVTQARQEHKEDMEEQIELQTMQITQLGDVNRVEMAKNYRLQVALQQEAQQQQQGKNGSLAERQRDPATQQASSQKRGLGQGFNTGEGGTPQVQATEQQGGGPQQ